MKSVDRPIPPPKLIVDSDGFVDFGQASRAYLHIQAQYAGRYVDNLDPDVPNLCGDLRIRGSSSDYSSIRIHQDDIEIFVNRFLEYKRSQL